MAKRRSAAQKAADARNLATAITKRAEASASQMSNDDGASAQLQQENAQGTGADNSAAPDLETLDDETLAGLRELAEMAGDDKEYHLICEIEMRRAAKSSFDFLENGHQEPEDQTTTAAVNRPTSRSSTSSLSSLPSTTRSESPVETLAPKVGNRRRRRQVLDTEDEEEEEESPAAVKRRKLAARADARKEKVWGEGPPRVVPCLSCVRSMLKGALQQACCDHTGQGKRCLHCAKNSRKCEPVPALVLKHVQAFEVLYAAHGKEGSKNRPSDHTMGKERAALNAALEVGITAQAEMSLVRGPSGVSLEDMRRVNLLQTAAEADLQRAVKKFDVVKLLLSGKGKEAKWTRGMMGVIGVEVEEDSDAESDDEYEL